MDNTDPTQPWNYPEYKDDTFAPHNDPMYSDDPTKPWNKPWGKKEDLTDSEKRKYGIR